ncbi:MAG: serine/threonine protein kinase, partial [Planctomycetaceae bacterium]|nr:serine/threonine protein kinase [Planctomycetaceae bacterium]
MNEPLHPDLKPIEQVCATFERAWKSGEVPLLEEALAMVEAHHRSELLLELLKLEVRHRRELGEEPQRREYTSRFPHQDQVLDQVFGEGTESLSLEATASTLLYNSQFIEDSEPQTFSQDRIRYQALRSHAKGGLGEVFLARDTELDREVALKEIQSRYAEDPDSRSRFVMEAELTGKLEHPSIVPVYGLGTYPDGRPYYAMKFIRGESLDHAVRRFHQERKSGKLGSGNPFESVTFRKLLGRFVDVCQAVGFAHERGVLHRDLKPANVML